MLDSLVILIDLGSNNTIYNDVDMNKSSIHSMYVAFLFILSLLIISVLGCITNCIQ